MFTMLAIDSGVDIFQNERRRRFAEAEGTLPRVVATRSVFYPGTEWVMGWEIVDDGFKVLLSAKVPEVVAANIAGDVDRFLADQGLSRGDIRHWLAHTGGPRVLEAIRAALGLPEAALERR